MISVRRALLSGWNKQAMLELARALSPRGVELFATRGTAAALEGEGLAVTRLEAWLDFPEILGGRVKTLHPRLHAAILAPRTPEGLAELASAGSVPMDLVAADLYPFEDSIRDKPGDIDHGFEHIDIGGVTLLRAAAKNSAYVVVLPDPGCVREFLGALKPGGPSEAAPEDARRWAARAFGLTAAYDAAIARWMSPEEFPETITLSAKRALSLRYGENPHQRAAWYSPRGELPFEPLHEGKEISWNNLLDVDAALSLARQLPAPAAVVVKHTNPCGAAVGKSAAEAILRAWQGDSLSAFGGILALNGVLGTEAAEHLRDNFVEVVVAGDFDPGALEMLRAKKGLRILKSRAPGNPDGREVRTLLGGLGIQAGEAWVRGEWSPVGRHAASKAALGDLELAWWCASAGRSNGIALVRDGMLIGMGTGQTSRVDAVHMAIYKAERCGHEVRGAALASDGFFPFRDGVDLAASAGVSAIVQPGGSRRDNEVIEAADEHGIAMLMTGKRCFRH